MQSGTKKRNHIVNIVFAFIILFTLILAFAYYMRSISGQGSEIFGHSMDGIGVTAMFFMPLIAECDTFFVVKYFIQPKEDRRRPQTAVNIIRCVFSGVTASIYIYTFALYMLNGRDDSAFDILYIWFFMGLFL